MSSPADGWLPWLGQRGMDGLGAVLAVTRALLPDVPLLPVTPATVLAALVRNATGRLRGRRMTAPVNGVDVPFTLADLRAPADDPVELAAGRFAWVRAELTDVGWPDVPLRRVSAYATDVRFRYPVSNQVRAAAIALDIVVAVAHVQALIAAERPSLRLEFAPDGAPVLTHVRGWPSIEVRPEIGPGEVVVRPVAVRIAGRRWRLPTRTRPVVIPLGAEGVRLTALGLRADEIVLHAVVEDVSFAV